MHSVICVFGICGFRGESILVYVILKLKSFKINDIWFNPILEINFEVYIEFYHDYSVAENH